MKTLKPNKRQNERGFMVMVLLGILAFLLIFTSANIQSLNFLHEEIDAIQKKQIDRLQKSEARSSRSESMRRQPAADSIHHN